MSESLFNGRRFRALTVVDNFSRECLAIHAGKSLRGEGVVGVMEVLLDEYLSIHWFRDPGLRQRTDVADSSDRIVRYSI